MTSVLQRKFFWIGLSSALFLLIALQFTNADTLGTCTITAGNPTDTCVYLPIAIKSNGATEPQLTLQTQWGNLEENKVLTGDIFAIWWHKNYDLEADAAKLITDLKQVRQDAINELGLADPPNIGQGFYYNVYLHNPEPGSDNYPSGWGNGQGTDDFGLPYLTLPLGAHEDLYNVSHEGFHIFQYSATSPGFEYSGDSAWYIEASANWYASRVHYQTSVEAFLEAAAIYANPYQTLWHSWDNGPTGDPQNWQRLVHQYAMTTYLFYLSEVENVPTNLIVDGFFAGTKASPQQYLYQNIPNLRTYFGNWAAHNVAEFDYMSRAQWQRALDELANVGDQNDINPYANTLSAAGTNGSWFQPATNRTPRPWSYNVIRLQAPVTARYQFEFDGDAVGSEGVTSFFEVRLVVEQENGYVLHTMPLTDNTDGTFNLDVTAQDKTIYLVIAAVPEHFSGNQLFPYKVRIGHE